MSVSHTFTATLEGRDFRHVIDALNERIVALETRRRAARSWNTRSALDEQIAALYRTHAALFAAFLPNTKVA